MTIQNAIELLEFYREYLGPDFSLQRPAEATLPIQVEDSSEAYYAWLVREACKYPI